MMRDKIIKMSDGQEYYILEDVEYNGKKYVLSLECNLDKDTVNENDYLVMEVAFENDDLMIKIVDDVEVAKVVVSMLLNKVKNN